jgi:hypothetical protein
MINPTGGGWTAGERIKICSFIREKRLKSAAAPG